MVIVLLAISISLIIFGYHQPTTLAVVQVKRQARRKNSISLNVSNKKID